MSKLRFLFVILLFLLVSSCNKEKITSDSEINIAVSIPPFADFTKQITGNRANIYTLIPPGANAHSFEPTPKRLKQIFNADLYFRVGEIFKFENLILNKIGANVNNIVDCSTGISFINNNPHYWLSPKNVKLITQNIMDYLVEAYPQHKKYFTNNRNRFISKINSLDTIIINNLKNINQRVLFVYHPAWTYLADHYNLEQLVIEQDGKSPNAKDLFTLIKLAKSKGVRCVFFDPHFNEGAVETLAQTLKLSIDSLDPLPEDFLLNLEDIGQKLNKYLK